MIVQLANNIAPESRLKVFEKIKAFGFVPNEVSTQNRDYLVCIGKGDLDLRQIGSLEGVADVHRVTDEYKLVSRKWRVGPTMIDLGDGVKIGGGGFAIMAGPCSIESEEQVIEVVEHLKTNGVRIMRGGVFKPRSSPYAFRGLGIDGLKMWHAHTRAAGIKIITEVMMVSQIEEMMDFVDVFQVGARNSQNYNLLEELGRAGKPVLLKRGISGTIADLLNSAEYIFSKGNEHLMLCERGIRTYETASRNTFDINAIPILREKSHLPVIADPSHGIGIRRHVMPIALAAAAAGADGVIYETHCRPEEAKSDGQQTLDFGESARLLKKLAAVLAA